jgi:hypothetical protein
MFNKITIFFGHQICGKLSKKPGVGLPDWPVCRFSWAFPPSLLYNEYRVFPGGKERPGRNADPSLPSSAVGHERVELYLYSPYGPYDLYRASVPVQGDRKSVV